MKKNFSLLSGIFLISLMFILSIFSGTALAGQCDNCHGLAVGELDPVTDTDQEKFQPVRVASIQSDKPADSFETFLASIMPDVRTSTCLPAVKTSSKYSNSFFFLLSSFLGPYWAAQASFAIQPNSTQS